MDAFRVILENMRLKNYPLSLHASSFLMAASTHKGNAEGRNSRLGAFGASNRVAAVTRLAIRRQCIATGNRFAMETFLVEFLFGGMARAAYHRRHRDPMRHFLPFKIHVARDARKVCVHRLQKDCLIDKERYCFPSSLRGQTFVFMAREAVAVILAKGYPTKDDSQEQGHDCPPSDRRQHGNRFHGD
jgi:hypothetical protein